MAFPQHNSLKKKKKMLTGPHTVMHGIISQMQVSNSNGNDFDVV